jgi:acyl-CoA thioester hydrolase
MLNKTLPSFSRLIYGKYYFPIRVYYEDTDAGGVVYYANYLKFAERARTEMLRLFGCQQQDMKEKLDCGFVVRRCNADYHKPARLDDVLEIETEIIAVGGASVEMCQRIIKGNETLVVMDIKLACMSFSGSATRVPESIRTRMHELISSNGED